MTDQKEEIFGYFMNSKKHILVVTFKGKAKRADSECFTKCQKEIIESSASNVIFNMTGVQDMANEAFSFFSNLQLSIRDKEKKILVCGLNSLLRPPLLERGVIRSAEIVPTLVEALQKIVTPEVKEK